MKYKTLLDAKRALIKRSLAQINDIGLKRIIKHKEKFCLDGGILSTDSVLGWPMAVAFGLAKVQKIYYSSKRNEAYFFKRVKEIGIKNINPSIKFNKNTYYYSEFLFDFNEKQIQEIAIEILNERKK